MTAAVSSRQALVILLCVLLGAVGGVLLKAGAVAVDYEGGSLSAFRSAITQPLLLTGVMLYAVPVAGYIVLLKSVPLSVLQPMLALTYVVTPALGSIFYAEEIPALRWVGIGVIVFGVIIVARS